MALRIQGHGGFFCFLFFRILLLLGGRSVIACRALQGKPRGNPGETGTVHTMFPGFSSSLRTSCPCQRTFRPARVSSVTKGLHRFPLVQNSQAYLPFCYLFS